MSATVVSPASVSACGPSTSRGPRRSSPTGWPDVEVVSNVFSLSSGITGLILAVVDGVRDDGLVRLHDGRWLMTGRDLWSSGVEAWVERSLARLDLTTFEAIRHLALAHDSRPWAPCPLVAHTMLKELEARGFLSVADGPDGLGIRLLPSAMADYFRFTDGRDSALESCPCGGSAPTGLHTDDHTARLVRSTRGRSTRTRDERAAEWPAAPSAATALPYLEALLETPRGAGDVERVFAGTSIASAATPEDALDLVLLRACAEGSLTRPVPERFDELTRLFPALRPALDLFARVLADGSSAVDASPATMAMLRSVGVSAESLCVAALAYVALLEGDVREAAYWERRVPACPLLAVGRLVGAVRALVPLARGDFGLALAGSMRSLEIARAEEELTGILLHSYYAALALLALGRWTEALDVADTALAYGPPGPAHTGFYRALLWLASLVNHWLGENRLATLLEAQASTLVVTDEALPAMQGDVGPILRSLIGGQKAVAMSELRRLADGLAAERNLLTAMFTLVVGLCVWPEPPTFAQLGELASNALGVPRWPLVDLVRASFEEPDRLTSLAETIGRTPHSALAALVLAARVRQECGQRSELAKAIGAALLVLVLVREEPLPGLRDPEDAAGERQRTESLTPRETQVALLAATLPNTAVASMLGIGVRTIENHIHSALKKTGARNRQELFARLRGTS